MPALVAFGRRWKVGSDDFVLPGFIDVSVKLCWLIASLVVYFRNNDQMTVTCHSGRHMKIYIYGIWISLATVIVVDMAALKTSMIGHMMDIKSRRFLTPLIYVRLSCEFIDVCWNLLGTIWAYGGTMRCEEAPEAVWFIKRYILCNWCSVVVLFLFMCYLYDELGGKNNSDELDPFKLTSKHYAVKHEEFWSKKWRRLYCYYKCCGGNEMITDGFKDIGRVFSTFLRDYDFVATDVAAGFIALYQMEKEARTGQSLSDRPVSMGSPTLALTANYNKIVQSLENGNHFRVITKQPQIENSKLKITDDTDLKGDLWLASENDAGNSFKSKTVIDDVVLANHYLEYVIGSYGWILFIIAQYKNRAFRRLMKQVECCSCFRSQDFLVAGDNCCLCNSAAVKETSQIEAADLVYVSFKNTYFRPVFYVAVDHKTKAFVVSIRGSNSLKDLFAGLNLLPQSVEIDGIPPNVKVYHGVALCASKVFEILERKKIFENLSQKHPDYNPVFTGSSLGAGISTVLGFMYQQRYPKLRVFAFSPIGGLLSQEGSKLSESFTLSIVYGDDMVPRLSLPAIETLKNKIIGAITMSRTPKYRIIVNGIFCGCRDSTIKFVGDEENQEQSSPYPQRERRLEATLPKRSPLQSTIFSYPMYLPGKIIHVTENKNYSDLQGGTRWQLQWADKTDFSDFVVSPRMLKDHYHFRLQKALHEFVVVNRDSVTLKLM